MSEIPIDDGSDKPLGYVTEDGHLEVRDFVDNDGTAQRGYCETELGQHDRWMRQAPELFEKYMALLARDSSSDDAVGQPLDIHPGTPSAPDRSSSSSSFLSLGAASPGLVEQMRAFPKIQAEFHSGDREPGTLADAVPRATVDRWADELEAALALSGAEIARLHQVIHRLHCERDAAHAELARLAPYVQQLEQENKDLVARIGHPDAESTVAVPRLPEESHS